MFPLPRLALCALCAACAAGAAPVDEVVKWANSISANVDSLLQEAGGYSIVDRALTDAAWRRERMPAGEAAAEARKALFRMFESVANIAKNLKSNAEQGVELGSFQREYWDADGFRERVMPLGIKAITPVPEAACTVEEAARYDGYVNFDTSAVKLSTSSRRSEARLGAFIEWSAILDSVFKSMRLRSDSILNQWAADASGAVRFYPGRAWPRNAMGAPKVFEAAEQAWWGERAASRNVAIVVDGSGSMGRPARWRAAVAAVARVLARLSEADNFAVLLATASHQAAHHQVFPLPPVTYAPCRTSTLLPATPSRRAEALRALTGHTPRGSTAPLPALRQAAVLAQLRSSPSPPSPCAQAIVFVTDDAPSDPEAHCGAGSYTEDGAWTAPPLCNLTASLTQSAVEDVLSGEDFEGKLFSIVVRPEVQSYATASSAACAFGGARMVVSGPAETDGSLGPVFAWLSSFPRADGVAWTSPHPDAFGTGLRVLAATRPFFQGGAFRGVVGASLPVAEVQRVFAELRPHAHGYFFLANAKGEAVVHPYASQPPRGAAAAGVDPLIEELETTANAAGVVSPSGFAAFIRSVLAGADGQAVMHGPVRRAKGEAWQGYDVVTLEKSYACTSVPETGFSVCWVNHTAPGGFRYWLPKDESLALYGAGGNEVPAVFHRVDLYPKETLERHGLRAAVNASGRAEIAGKSGYFPRKSCFCGAGAALGAAPPTPAAVAYVHEQITELGAPAACEQDSEPFQLTPRCVRDIRASAEAVYGPWEAAHATTFGTFIHDQLLERRLVSYEGTVLTMPAGAQPSSLVPEALPGYQSALHDPTIIHISAPRFDVLSDVPVMFASKAIMKVEDVLSNTSCSSHVECLSGSVQAACLPRGICSSMVSVGVLSVKFPTRSWKAAVQALTAEDAPSLSCGAAYPCQHPRLGSVAQCETRCYVVDSSGVVLYNSSASWPQQNRTLAVALSSTEGELMRQLLYGIRGFNKKEVARPDGECPVTDNWRLWQMKARREAADWDVTQADARRKASFRSQETIEPCAKLESFYTLNPAVFSTARQGVLDDGCVIGSYAAALIPKTNAVFVALWNYSSHIGQRTGGTMAAPRDFGCSARNTLHAVGSVPVGNLSCPLAEYPSRVTVGQQTCGNISSFPCAAREPG
ncbi:VWFA and cache domain-containing protein [Diplonema papillatum]|nr:VWFA and cache domain-containing protein [Diplonema papillatum]